MSHHHHRGPETETDWAAMAELLDLEGDVLRSYLLEVIGWVRQLASELPRRRVVDLGSGTGTATLPLAQRFDGTEVIAVDVSSELLAHVRAKTLDLGLAHRVRTVQADLDAAWPALDPVDVVWASMSLHHLAEPDRVLKEVFAAIRPGGLMVVAEMGAPMRFLPDDIGFGRPGLEARCHAAMSDGLADSLPHLGADWAARLEHAGFAVEAQRSFAIDLTPPLPASTRPYALGSLRRARTMLEDRLAADDMAAIDTLIDSEDPAGVWQRDDLHVRTTRDVWVARRP